MKHLIEVIISHERFNMFEENQIKSKIEIEAKRLIGDELFQSVDFVEKHEWHAKRYSAELYSLGKEQVEHIESMLSFVPKEVKNAVMDEILNK